jgi:hypothetical protein
MIGSSGRGELLLRKFDDTHAGNFDLLLPMENPMTHDMMNEGLFEQLQALCERLEMDWNERRDHTIVDLLAAEYPQFAADLYEFFAILAQSDFDLSVPRMGASADRNALNTMLNDAVNVRVQAWLTAEGHARASELARQSGIGVSSTPPRTDRPEVKGPTSVAASSGRSMRNPGAGDSALRAGTDNEPSTFLRLLKERTNKRTPEIASALGVDTSFLAGLDNLHERVPPRAAAELAARADRSLRVERGDTLPTLVRHPKVGNAEKSLPLPRAASRTKAFSSALTFAKLVQQSHMSEEEKAFWLALADEPPNTSV